MNKRIISFALAAMLSFTALSANISAAENGGSCNGNHGPWITYCSGDTHSETRTHTFDYNGYRKTCTYIYVIAKTNKECEYCGYINNSNLHSHGYRGHIDGCGWINGDDSTCKLNK